MKVKTIGGAILAGVGAALLSMAPAQADVKVEKVEQDGLVNINETLPLQLCNNQVNVLAIVVNVPLDDSGAQAGECTQDESNNVDVNKHNVSLNDGFLF